MINGCTLFGGTQMRVRGWRSAFPAIEPFMEQAKKQTGNSLDPNAARYVASSMAYWARDKRVSDATKRYWRIQHAIWNCQ